jgi:hypothetical protein
MRAVFLTRRRTTILRCRIGRTHIVVRLTAPIIRGIFARHWAVHVSTLVLWSLHVVPVVLWTIHVMPIVLRTSNFAVHFAIIHAVVDAIVYATVDPIVHTPVYAIIDAMVSYWPGCDYIVSAKFSGT